MVEELENGLHPSQAATIIGLLRQEAEQREVHVLVTSHSPALLDALPGALHHSVVVCFRDDAGRSLLCRLPDLDSYLRVATAGSLGDAAIADAPRSQRKSRQDPGRAPKDLFAAP